MLKLSHSTKNAALAGLLAAGVAGSAAVTLAPVVAHAQVYRDRDDRPIYRDRDDRVYRGDWDNRYYHGYYRPYGGWVGIGVPGFGIGFSTNPYPYYGPYCSAYDYYNGFCTY